MFKVILIIKKNYRWDIQRTTTFLIFVFLIHIQKSVLAVQTATEKDTTNNIIISSHGHKAQSQCKPGAYRKFRKRHEILLFFLVNLDHKIKGELCHYDYSPSQDTSEDCSSFPKTLSKSSSETTCN